MHLFNGVISISSVSYLIFSIMAIVALGYLLGRVTVKGISLGTAGVFRHFAFCTARFFL
ncbi:MAG: hypothetical protein L6V93_16945 [Clostridiales bacterium]|nr:MAG: hypothetical protein L6V93_16945 [Clostridiales bacterium]